MFEKKIRDEIFRVKETITDLELFSSRHFFNYLRSTLRVAMGELARKRPVKLVCIADKDNELTAKTDDETVYINVFNEIVVRQRNRVDRYLTIVGMIVHETGHRLFTDFKNWNQYFDGLMTLHVPEAPDEPKWEMMMDDLQTYPNYKRMFISIAHRLWNTFEDGYIENRLYGVFSGLFTMGLHQANESLFSRKRICSEELLQIAEEEDELKKEAMFLAFVLNNYLRIAKDYPLDEGDVAADADAADLWSRYQIILSETMPYIEDLKWQSDTRKRMQDLNYILMSMFDLMPGVSDDDNEHECEEPEQKDKADTDSSDDSKDTAEPSDSIKEQSDSGGNAFRPDTDSDLSDEEMEMMKQILNAGSTPSGEIPVGSTSPVDENSDDVLNKEEIGEKKEASSEISETAKERNFNEVLAEVAEEMAEDNAEEEQKDALCAEAAEICRSKGFAPWNYVIHRADAEYLDTDLYQKSYDRIAEISDSTVRLINRILKIREESGSSKGYMYGRFDAAEYPRAAMNRNGKCFRKNTDPIGKPKAVFAVLVDESGSMRWDNKYLAARDTAILLHDILDHTGIAHMIIGHTASGSSGTCDLYVYHDFEEAGNRDKYRLAGISERNGNRDGAAITYCCEKLLKRPEKDKVLIVISDGEPTEVGFHDCDAMEDTILTVKEYSRKKIQVFGAVIDGNMENIRRIYGDRTMDVTDISDLGKELSGLVKRFAVR